MSARWAEALDTQLDAWKWYRTDRGERELRSFAESVLAKAIDPDQSGLAPEDLQRATEHMFGDGSFGQSHINMVASVPGMMWSADPIYVDPEMMPLVHAALDQWQPEPLVETDMLIPVGFLILPEPVYLTDIRQKRMSVRAFLWGNADVIDDKEETVSPGIALALFSDTRDDDDYGQSPLVGRGTTLALAHMLPWRFGTSPAEAINVYYGAFTGIETVQCILRLVAQTIAVRSQRDAPRQTDRRLARAQFPARRITVVTLRRPEGERDKDQETSHVEWTRRWLVGGHWRQQWYPSLGMHRQIWISPYVKGPTDKELIVPKARVFQFVQ